MRQVLRFLSVSLALGATGTWLVLGANRGWTKTSIECRTVDAATGREAEICEHRFVPGLDFLGPTLLGAMALGGISFLSRDTDRPAPCADQRRFTA